MTKIEKNIEIAKSEQKIFKVQSQDVMRIPSILALSESKIENFPDEFSRELAKKAMNTLFQYCQKLANGEKLDQEKNLLEIDILDEKIQLNQEERRIATLTKEEYFSYLGNTLKNGFCILRYETKYSTKGVPINIFGILQVLDYETKKIKITTKKIAEWLFETAQELQIEEKKLERDFLQYTSVLEDWENYEVEGSGFRPEKNKKIKGFYAKKLLFYIFSFAKEGRFIVNTQRFLMFFGKEQDTFKDFSKNILKPALENIKNVFPWMEIHVENIKNHPRDKRKITQLDFLFQPFKILKKGKQILVENSKQDKKIELAKFQNPKSPSHIFLYCPQHEQELIEKQRYDQLAFSMLSAAFDKVRNSISIFEKEKKEKFSKFFLKEEDFFYMTEKNTNYFLLCRNIKFFCEAVKRNEYEKYFLPYIKDPKRYILEVLINGFFDSRKIEQKLNFQTHDTQGMKAWKTILNILMKYFVSEGRMSLDDFETYFMPIEKAFIEKGDNGDILVIHATQVQYEKINKMAVWFKYIFEKKIPHIKNLEYEIFIPDPKTEFIKKSREIFLSDADYDTFQKEKEKEFREQEEINKGLKPFV